MAQKAQLIADVDVNVDVNVGEVEKKIIELVIVEPKISAEKIFHKIGKAKRTAERYLKALQEKRHLTRSGSDKNGIWKVIK